MGNEPNEYLGEQLKRVEWEPDIAPTLLEINILTGIWRTKRYRVATHILREYIKLRINAAFADYRAVTPPSDGAAEALARKLWDNTPEGSTEAALKFMADEIADALAAARAPLEAKVEALEDAAQKAVTEACEFCRYGKKELPGRRDYCKSEHCQWLKIINALAEKG